MTIDASSQQTDLLAIEHVLQQAIAQHQAGHLQEAENYYRSILQACPNQPEANYGMGMLALQKQQPATSLSHFTAALDADPTRGHYWLSYIDALYQAGQMEEARQIYALAKQQGLDADEALTARLEGGTPAAEQSGSGQKCADGISQPASMELRQSSPETSTMSVGRSDKPGKDSSARRQKDPNPQDINKLLTLFNKGQFTKVVGLAKTMTASFPRHVVGWKMLGIALNQIGRSADALEPMQKAAELSPEDADVHNILGITLHNLNRTAEAEVSYRRALQIQPENAQALCNLGATLQSLGRTEEAAASYRSALKVKPGYTKALGDLSAILGDLGKLAEAEATFRLLLQGKPDDAAAHYRLSKVLFDLGKLNEAEASIRRALQINPDKIGVFHDLGWILHLNGKLDEAEASFRRVLQVEPDNASVLNSLGLTLQDLGRVDEAETCFRRALQINPDLVMAYSNLLYFLTINSIGDAQTLFAEHRRFGQKWESPFGTNHPPFANSTNPERCLQVGFVSGDLRNHAVANYIEPVLAHLTGYPQLSLHAYSNYSVEDAVTQRIRKHFTHWHAIANLSDAALAEKIRCDGIDILIDLSGHTAKNRLLTFARKPAPVQASWIGYPGTTGLTSMDYYLADRFLLPTGKFDDQFTEKIVRLPANAPFLPYEFTSSVNALPALSNGYMTFGSFNRPNKLNKPVIALWSQLLRAIPDSRMVLGGMPQDGQYETLIQWFAQEGIARERLSFYPRSGMDQYLKLHQQVDVCLDTFPFNGGTTTLHALWMGIPTLTLAGDTMPGRVGAAVHGHVELEEFVAHDAADFVQKGLAWAGNIAELSEIRSGLRGRIAKSAMSQSALIAAGLDRALRIMWRRWCTGFQAESFEVKRQDVADAMREASK